MQSLLWGLKQLLPLMYRTVYKENGQVVYATWRMWMGRSFSIERVTVNSVLEPPELAETVEQLANHSS